MVGDPILRLVTEYGPWVMLVFYLLYRDVQKDTITRDALDRNTKVLVEITTMLRDRVQRGYF